MRQFIALCEVLELGHMLGRALGLLCLLWAATVSAAGPVLVLSDAGYQVMTVGEDGKVVLSPVTPITQVVDMRTGKPGPTPPPPDVTTDPIAKQVRDWAAAVNDPTSQQALREVYSRIGAASQGQSREKVITALRQATDGVLDSTGGRTKWQPFRDNLSKLIDAEEAQGPIDWPKFCASVAKGLETGTALDPALLQLIINLILQIIQLFFGGGTGV